MWDANDYNVPVQEHSLAWEENALAFDGGVRYWSSSGGTSFTGRPYAIEYNPGGYQEMDVFARGNDGNVYKKTWISPSWGGWHSLGGNGNLASDPVAVQYKSEMDVFARGNDGHIYKDTWNGSSWSGFTSLGGNLVGDPTAMVYNGSELDVYAKGTNGDLWKDGWNGSKWGGFSDMGGNGKLAGSPYAIQYKSEMDVFVRFNDGHIYKDTWNGTRWGGLSSWAVALPVTRWPSRNGAAGN